jgi:curli biogenesis system outer membrane secretion channel CsgG
MKTKHDISARVQISTRLVSPDTAEVLAVSQGTGEVNRKGVKVDIRD